MTECCVRNTKAKGRGGLKRGLWEGIFLMYDEGVSHFAGRRVCRGKIAWEEKDQDGWEEWPSGCVAGGYL